MERSEKEKASLAVTAIALMILFLLFVVQLGGARYDPLLGVSIVVVAAIGLIAFISSIAFSSTGWSIEGTTLEWIVAAMISPFAALFFYQTSSQHRREKNEMMDPDDRRRMERL
jgi:uncharacterized protein YacL